MNLSAISFYDNLVFGGTFFTTGALDSDLHVQNDFSRQIQSKNVRIYNIAFHHKAFKILFYRLYSIQ